MTGFRWTGLEIGCLVLLPFFVAGFVWLEVGNRRHNRALAEAEEKDAPRPTLPSPAVQADDVHADAESGGAR